MQYLASSAIHAVDYDQNTRTLSVWFVDSGGPYIYPSVPEMLYVGLLSASSAGSYFNVYIRPYAA